MRHGCCMHASRWRANGGERWHGGYALSGFRGAEYATLCSATLAQSERLIFEGFSAMEHRLSLAL
ncbi:hypothetical protein Cenrod_0694 [Candidatus Symbiobacter mobilis CR]|uniref:Uncharacterized protein n=1 Tax=Candidatus Symbiobacter mobilis CR TaxID=946483 RepID=U5N5K8_9BURK|nr:hypothetical protein Cenrod_0694 [Candidatus Symbiobacter mobilis CR]